MKTGWIKDLLAVVESGSMVKAAEARFISQPTFSRRIQAVENTLGVTLIDRKFKPARPRRELVALRQDMQDTLQQMRLLQKALLKIESPQNTMITLASQHTTTVVLGASIVRKLNTLDNITVNLCSENRDGCLFLLVQQKADIAIIYTTLEERGHPGHSTLLENKTIAVDRFIPVSLKNNYDIVRQNLDSGELPIINYPADTFMGEVMTRNIFSKLPDSISVQLQTEIDLPLAAKHLVLTGIGVGWVPQSLVAKEIQQKELVDLSSYLPTTTLSLVACRMRTKKTKILEDAWIQLTNTT